MSALPAAWCWTETDNAALNILAAALVAAAPLRTAGQVGTGSVSPEHIASGQTASTAVFARARRKRAG